ncbi:MAG: sigma-70 family RNA polymerase sigma factor [Taibaiella sp.]|nr:sigma-70 family RNA polymerase sigma factor [Taibaiella sp.]
MLEQELITSLKQNSTTAQKTAYHRYAGAVYATARRYVTEMDAEEITSDVFLKVFGSMDQFTDTGTGSFWYWMKKITVNQCLMQLRRQKISYDELDEQVIEESSGDDQWKSWSIREIIEMIEKLPPGYRTVFNLYVLESMSHKEIAALLDISEQTSKSQLHKARKLLQSHIKKV